MTTRSKQLAFARCSTNDTSLYEVPSGHVTIVRSMWALNEGGSPTIVAFELEKGAVTIDLPPAAYADKLGTFEHIVSDSWWVMDEGDILHLVAYPDAGSPDIAVVVSGAELVL